MSHASYATVLVEALATVDHRQEITGRVNLGQRFCELQANTLSSTEKSGRQPTH